MKVFKIDYGKIVDHLPIFVTIENPYTKATVICRAVWDTGAMHSGISSTLFDKLKLPRIGRATIMSVNTRRVTPTTFVDIALQDDMVFKRCFVTVIDISDNIDALLGMDIITRGNFHIDNHTDSTGGVGSTGNTGNAGNTDHAGGTGNIDKTVLTFAAEASQP